MKFKAIIFDFNGVLLWDRQWHERAWNELSKELRGRPLTRFEHEHYVHGRTTGKTLLFLLGRKPSPRESKKLLEKKERLYQQIALRSHSLKLSPGSVKLFNILKQHKIKQTIATSSPLINVKFYYKHLGLNKWFPRRRIVYDDQSFPGKPAPDIYLKAARKVNVDVKKCIVVEDAKSGVLSARRAAAGKIIGLAAKDNTSTLKILKLDKLVKNLRQINIADLA